MCAGQLGTTQTRMTTKLDGTLGRGTSVLTGLGLHSSRWRLRWLSPRSWGELRGPNLRRVPFPQYSITQPVDVALTAPRQLDNSRRDDFP